jgi:hypothetical protein
MIFHTFNIYDFLGDQTDIKEHLSFFAQPLNLSGFLIRNYENNLNLNLIWILIGFKPLRKKSISSPKFSLQITFMNMNLDRLTCIKEFEIYLQVAIRTWFNNNQKKQFEFEFKLKPSYTMDYNIEVV